MNSSNPPGEGERHPESHLISEPDAPYEQEVARNPGSVKPWLEYYHFKRKHASRYRQAFVLERAVLTLPRSYKLWKLYLELRMEHVAKLNPAQHAVHFFKVNGLFERALVLLNKYPRIWEMYLEFLMRQPLVTTTRRAFDRALRALPITQHARIWKLYRPFASSASGETAVKVWRRYVQLHPEESEDFVEILAAAGRHTEAIRLYMKILNDPKFVHKDKSAFQVWTEMLELLVDNAKDIQTGEDAGIDVDDIVRSGMAQFPDQRGILWVTLARYWINRGHYEQARDVFEEGVTTVMTVSDFTVVFDAYTQAEEAIIAVKMNEEAIRSSKSRRDDDQDADLDIRLVRFEQLLDRRPFLINDLLLRKNPHDVGEWEKKVKLWHNNMEEIINVYTDALAKVNPSKAQGNYLGLWTGFARLYEDEGDVPSARIVMDKAVKVPFKTVNDLSDAWIEWAELELRHEGFSRALEILAKATQGPKRSTVDYFDESLSPQQRVHKSWKLWSYYIDLVESLRGKDETRKLYERTFELKIATPQTVVNYANFLEAHQYYEESFKVYERGLELFHYPVAFELWNLYLTKAVERQLSMERLRDLFEQALENCPPRFAKVIFLMYGELEEERGLARHAMRIYERATRGVADEDRLGMFAYYVTKSASNFGLPSTRPIYENAIAALPDKDAKEMCLRFADMERRLGEIDRARAIMGHASQFCDPRTSPEFWTKWEAFEVQHGNEDTFKEMLRIKRSVQAKYKCVLPPFLASLANGTAARTSASSRRRPSPAGSRRPSRRTGPRSTTRSTRWRRSRGPRARRRGSWPRARGRRAGRRRRRRRRRSIRMRLRWTWTIFRMVTTY